MLASLEELKRYKAEHDLTPEQAQRIDAKIAELSGPPDDETNNVLAKAAMYAADPLRDKPWERPIARPDSESTSVTQAPSLGDRARMGALRAGKVAESGLGMINSAVGTADDLITGGAVTHELGRARFGIPSMDEVRSRFSLSPDERQLNETGQALEAAKREHPIAGMLGGSAIAAYTPGGLAKTADALVGSALGVEATAGIGKLALRIAQGAGGGALTKAGQNVVAERPVGEDIGGAAAAGALFRGVGGLGEYSAENIRGPGSPLKDAVGDVESGGGKLGSGGPVEWARERLSRVPGMGGLAPKLQNVPGYNTRVPADVADNFRGPKEVEVPRSAARTIPPPPSEQADVKDFEDFWRPKAYPKGVAARKEDIVGRVLGGEPERAPRSVPQTLEHPEDIAADKAARGLAPAAAMRNKGIPREFAQVREIYAGTPEGQVERYPEATQSEFLRMVRSLSHSKTSGLPEKGLPGKLPLVDRETPALALNDLYQVAKPGEASAAKVKFETMPADEARALGFKVPKERLGDVAIIPRKTTALKLDRIRNAIDEWADANSKRLPEEGRAALQQAVREDIDRFPWPESKLGPAPEATLDDGTMVRGLSALRRNEGKVIGENQRRMANIGVTNPKASEEDIQSALHGAVRGYGQPGRIDRDQALKDIAAGDPELLRLLQNIRTVRGMQDVARGAPGGVTNRSAIIRKAQVHLDPFAQQVRNVAPHVGRGASTLTKEQRDAMLRELTFGRMK